MRRREITTAGFGLDTTRLLSAILNIHRACEGVVSVGQGTDTGAGVGVGPLVAGEPFAESARFDGIFNGGFNRLDIMREDAVIAMAAAGILKAAHRPKYEYEIKFAVPLAQAHEFLAATRGKLRPQVYDESLPIAFSRTTYLDTPDRRYLASSEQPVSRRLRIREYAGAPAAGTPVRLMNLSYLEYKESRAGQRRKARLRIAAPDVAGILVDPTLLLDKVEQLGAAEREAAQMLVQELEGSQLSTQLTTWYRRQSLRDESGRVRVTLDTEIAFCHPIALDSWQSAAPALPPDRVAGCAPSCLLEVKCQGTPPAWLRRAMSGLGEPPEKRLSKYAMGMRVLLQAQPHEG